MLHILKTFASFHLFKAKSSAKIFKQKNTQANFYKTLLASKYLVLWTSKFIWHQTFQADDFQNATPCRILLYIRQFPSLLYGVYFLTLFFVDTLYCLIKTPCLITPLFKKDFSDFRFRLNKPPLRLKKFLTKILMFSVDIIYFPHTFVSYYLIRFFVQLTETNFQLWLLCAAHKSMESIKSKPISTIAYLNIKYSMMMI